MRIYLKRLTTLLQISLLFIPIAGNSATARTFLYNLDYLQVTKQAWKNGEPWAVEAVSLLLRGAESNITSGPYSVTKTFHLTPVPGATPNDFVSIGAYYWPNPNTANGLPYVKRPGHVNPDSAGSLLELDALASVVNRLGIAYFLTGEEKCARRAAQLLRIFFINKNTKMNPNTEFGAVIPGVSYVGKFVVAGIGNAFRDLYSGLGLIEASPHWTKIDDRNMKKWSKDFLDWMESSPKAQNEFRAYGNHGSNYDMVAALLSMYIGDNPQAKKHVRHYMQRIPKQFATSGKQPFEMHAVNNFMYSTYNLGVAANIANLGDKLGLNVWDVRGPGGSGMRRTTNFLLPYMNGTKTWTYWPTTEVFPMHPSQYYGFLRQLSLGFCDSGLSQAAEDMSVNGQYSALSVNIIYPTAALSVCQPR
ncbi:putative Alginate lyase family protein [Gammaproteobacteria bacterium]